MSRIATTFAALQSSCRTALIPYIMTGFPQADCTPDLMHALVQAGADVIELGIPFSDPMADGSIIQAAGEAAIASGVGLPQVLEAVRTFRQHNTHTPVVLMGYANSIEAYCLRHASPNNVSLKTSVSSTFPIADPTIFAQAAADAGVDGILVVDYPPEECATLAHALRERGLDMIFLLAPTSTDVRMQQVAQWASGYVYYVSLKGVTGSGALDTTAVGQALPRIRQHISIPVGVGFGIRDAESACAIARHADAVVIGSKIIETIQHQRGADIARSAADFLQPIRTALNAQSAASEKQSM